MSDVDERLELQRIQLQHSVSSQRSDTNPEDLPLDVTSPASVAACQGAGGRSAKTPKRLSTVMKGISTLARCRTYPNHNGNSDQLIVSPGERLVTSSLTEQEFLHQAQDALQRQCC